MPQFTRFLYMPAKDPRVSVAGLIATCRELPSEGESVKEFRARMRAHGLWDKERAPDIYRFLMLAPEHSIAPSEFTRSVAEAEDDEAATRLIIDRLWHVNPILFKTVVELTGERAYLRDELHTYLDSFAYQGTKLSRVHVEEWLRLAIGLGLLKVIGIAIAPGERAAGYVERAKDLDIEEFLEEDEPEPELELEPEAQVDAPQPAAAKPPAPKPKPTTSYDSPRGRFRQVQIAVLRGESEAFSDETLDETAQRIREWWSEQKHQASGASAADFGLDSERWMDNAEESLYRLAVAAALIFRLGRPPALVVDAYHGLDRAGVLSDLYFGTAPDALPEDVDAQALMLASLVARRCAESSELANEIERATSAADVFSVLERALGGGLFSVELFWLMRGLLALGAIRSTDIGDFVTLPVRQVRDTLYRLGFLASPYAQDAQALMAAAKAARKLAGDAPNGEQMIIGFALAASCSYACAHRRKCEFACRERAEASFV